MTNSKVRFITIIVFFAGLIVVQCEGKDFENWIKEEKDSWVDIDLELEYKLALTKLSPAKRVPFDFWGLDAEDFYTIIERFPNSSNAHFLMGNIYTLAELMTNNYESAIKEYDKAIALDPNLSESYLNRGVSIWHSYELNPDDGIKPSDELKKVGKAAIESFDLAIKSNPKLYSAYFDKGVVLTSLGKENEAIKCFNQAIKIGFKVGPLGHLSVAQEANTEYLASAEPMCIASAFHRYIIETYMSVVIKGQRIIELSPTLKFISNEKDPIAFAYYHKGICYARANIRKYKLAIDSLTQAINLNPNVPNFYRFRSLAYLVNGDSDKALKDKEKAMQVIQKMDDLYYEWLKSIPAGTIIYIKGDWEAFESKDINAVYEATLKAIEQLDLSVSKKTKDATSALVIARDSEDSKVTIKLILTTEGATKLSVRVGLFGSEAKSHLIYDQIKKNLQ